jgi:hypothetical protein
MRGDRTRDGPEDDATFPAPADPSLRRSDTHRDDPPAGFPDTGEGSRLVAYQTRDGGVDLRWHIDPADIAYAEAAFRGGDDRPSPVLRLRCFDEHGDSHVAASARLDEVQAMRTGVAHYEAADLAGALQAELGMTSPGGGWVLVARSNRLEATSPVGVDFLAENRAEEEAVSTPAATAPGNGLDRQAVVDAAAPVSTRPAPGATLSPEFPFVAAAPVPGRRPGAPGSPPEFPADAGAASPPAGGAASAAPSDSSGEIDLGGRAPVPAASVSDRFAMLSADSQRPAAPDARSSNGLGNAVHAREQDLNGAEMPGRWMSGLAEQDAGPPPAASPVARGSGPIVPPRADQPVSVSAELIVHGSAAPGTIVNLGGHGYRVGAGGRFSLRVPVRDPALVTAALAAVSKLPVASRAERDDENDTR